MHNKEGCLPASGKFMRPVAGRRLRGPAADDSPALPVSGGPDWCMSENLLIYGHQLLGLMKSIILNYCGIFILFLSLYCLLMESLPPTTFRSYCRLVCFLTGMQPATSLCWQGTDGGTKKGVFHYKVINKYLNAMK